MNPLRQWLRAEPVLSISFLLAAVSSVCLRPAPGALAAAIDFRTLGILLTLMLVMAGLRRLGLFTRAGRALLGKVSSVRGLALVLMLLCFFFSMAITNDVALITFVPFTVEVLAMAGLDRYLIRIIVLQTAAANLGSMLTPLGNPQNLYLYTLAGMSLPQFLALMLPYTALSLLCLLLLTAVLTGREKVPPLRESRREPMDRGGLALYIVLFVLALFAVVRLLPWQGALLAAVICVLMHDRPCLAQADYGLLGSFIFLFIFIANLKGLPAVSAWLQAVTEGREILAAVVCSQVLSNVPAAILLSGFTQAVPRLIIGVNLGGLGTLIASMASLISFRIYGAAADSRPGKYLAVFTAVNLGLLAVLGAAARVLS